MLIVTKNATRFKLDPRLIMAVIHTESHFNPYALSRAKAVGLMQIVPRFAGREAYRFIYGQSKVVTRNDLYDAGKNIEFGSAWRLV